MFQHTAARRRLVMDAVGHGFAALVSTHSRPKAAGMLQLQIFNAIDVSTHSRPKAAGCRIRQSFPRKVVSTHSRPKAAGFWNP